MKRKSHLAFAIGAFLCVGCESRSSVQTAEAAPSDSVALARRAEAERAHQDSIVRTRPGYIVDSILPVEEAIRRFQATLGPRPNGFADGAPTRTELISRFVGAIERNDTAALSRLVVTRSEFGYLIYPTSPNAAPPYRQPPDLVWLMRSGGTDKATARLLNRFGGRSFGFAGYSCPDEPAKEGVNELWSACVVRRVQPAGDTIKLRLFGTIIRRNGQFKFLSLTNSL